ncbi:helix-turn-helix transcriptional regulator [bacterium]|nr:helix-turn-helix transcriptional regulator [bacterium]
MEYRAGRFYKIQTEDKNKAEEDFYSTLELPTKFKECPQKLLTKRQLECLALAAFGFKNIEIGEILIISESTAKKTLEESYKRLKTNNRTNAVTLGFAYGILNMEILNQIFIKFNLKERLFKEEECWYR